MAHTKAQKAAAGNRDSRSKRLGVKLFGGQKAEAGNIIIRQKGNKVWPGEGTYEGKDFTIMAKKAGVVGFKRVKGKHFVFVS